MVKLLYRIALLSSRTVFFQNQDDRALFLRLGLVREEAAALLPGSGVDLDKFRPAAAPAQPAPASQTTFLLIARLIWDKGVKEYVEAARLVKRRFPDVRFQMLGFLDVENRGAITRSQMDAWVEEGLVEYLGAADDVRPFYCSGWLRRPPVLQGGHAPHSSRGGGNGEADRHHRYAGLPQRCR